MRGNHKSFMNKSQKLSCNGRVLDTNFLKDLEMKARIFRISLSQLFFKMGVLKNFVIFIGKTLYWSLFNNVAGPKRSYIPEKTGS